MADDPSEGSAATTEILAGKIIIMGSKTALDPQSFISVDIDVYISLIAGVIYIVTPPIRGLLEPDGLFF